MASIPDIDNQETQEWLDALNAVIETEGVERAHFLIESMIDQARRSGANLPYKATTAYVNTIPTHLQQRHPGNPDMERRIRALIRWNAIMTVLRANEKSPGVGGHIASFQSAATLYDVGFNHFFRAANDKFQGDLVYFQGHSSPGVYARAFLEGRISEDQLTNFRMETGGKGLSSYPHPWLMPDFWQFPTVSMGLGPIMGIYQARFLKYLHDRGIADTSDRKVWVFCGDGEMDEPESLGAISLASREKLDNLIFVVNCNLQRLDGPVRGNGKIIQELESDFRGSGWNVIKVIWGSYWDPLIAMDKTGLLKKRMEECVDGEYQNFKAKGGAYTREHFFGKYPELKEMVAAMSDQDIWRLNRGGHDPHKVFAAYAAATSHKGQPSVVLAKTVKGYGMGDAGEGQNITHQQKSMDIDSLKAFRDRFDLQITNEEVEKLSFHKPQPDSPEIKYMMERREALGGFVPQRKRKGNPLKTPPLSTFENMLTATGEREISTTMAFVRILSTLVRDKELGKYIVPIVPDEARTFGMEGMFRQLGIYSSVGQLYEPQDSDQVMFYKEQTDGQILEEGINEAGSFSSWVAAATSYTVNGIQMIPFYIFYSMFGFQRIGDLAWAAGDSRARGFLLGATAGRTTLNGEGLQHEDGHSQLMAAMIPNCVSYDPTFAYELAVIMQDGLKRMIENQEDVFYYITVMNENYSHPEMPKGSEADIIKGMYSFSTSKIKGEKVQLMGSGVILREVIEAQKILERDYGVSADVWSVTSFNELRKDALEADRWNRMNPDKPQKESHVVKLLKKAEGPIIASTDYMKSFAEQIAVFLPHKFVALGTDGFGRSDSREKLRHFFEVDRHYVVVATLKALSDEGKIKSSVVTDAIKKFKLDPNKPNPVTQ
ncbi:pyruvate dehydrogenase (acetyl-transferring), homodimeric type [Candidatus Methylopumilus universalis]|uniref:Pyruvate dehydrogenase E1 component n=1 Tax=Candidatus Methylopumilus universalis TaxID=2588536 RepID=A0AAX1EZW5_9PROT|nr:pyruvate dehydrogenase (acetyl-transferring), homodimeric type [Candidatus Methylopumilus universalis]QDC41299.1 pyruvate dehydrogenase (acetyl-transferring), homodimeric type [Candidatus Methylopumilus universalis]QDC42582.1 pyruvate dehydrogenase (acetyl-transferring), homodimeric type [Candidatus Methylopumilus universalis]QDC54968.1 pyruvate dehydrogenase (acetyl-transferring), homodimeric type [Candidatus Methylopumilus universalis]QDC56249.1 pyruvate dehydrogenase (acetyl-transferring)